MSVTVARVEPSTANVGDYKASKQLFGFSILYLFLLLVDRISGELIGHALSHSAT